ncbi:MAG: reverse transcriptase domain-containing protein [Elusimicrobiota bacterium]
MGMTRILQAIYEGDFLDVSYGYRPGLGCHEALKALDRGLMTKPVNFVVEVDIKGFFDHVDHKWLMECLKQRVSDPNFLSLVWRNLKAGVLDDGERQETEEGTPQGSVLSPCLSNVYLHYILDLWFEKKLKKTLRGHAELIRYCDDFVICTRYRSDAVLLLAEIKARLARFGLEVAAEKTRIVEFGRFAKANAEKQGGKPETFDFLGFTHYCSETLKGKFMVGRKTSGKKFRAKLKAMNLWLKTVRNAAPIKEWWPTLKAKLEGHYRYYGVSGNSKSISRYDHWSRRLVYKWVNRRSQKSSYTWEAFTHYLELHPLPKPRIVHNLYFAPAAL